MIANEYDIVFKGGDLTSLMTNKKGDKNLIPNKLSYPIHKLLSAFLALYNIHVAGAVMIGDYEVTAITITDKFEIENELIIRELYSFTGGRVNIQLAFDRPDGDIGAYAFWYDLDDYTCTFEKYVYGDTKESVKYNSLKDMLEAIKERVA